MLTIQADTRGIQEMLGNLRQEAINRAVRNMLKDTARDVAKGIAEQMPRVFQRPTRIIQYAFAMTKEATKEDLTAEIGIKPNLPDDLSQKIPEILRHHMPGSYRTRVEKPMELRQIHGSRMRAGQFLVPSRTAKRNVYGNVSPTEIRRMLGDVSERSGHLGGTRGPRYMWGTARSRGGKLITGIWDQKAFLEGTNALQFLVVNRRPRYRPVFDLYEIAGRIVQQRLPHHANLAIQYAIARSRR